MRTARTARRLTAAALLVFVCSAAAVSCFSFEEDCALINTCTQASAGPGGGTGGGTDDACVPSKAGGPVADTCGVFVSAAGEDAAAGTKAAPVATLGKAIAIAAAGAGRVYACAEELSGAISVPAGVAIYGGLDCAAGWAYAGAEKKTMVTALSDEVPLRIVGGEGTARLEDVHVLARDAKTVGGSSITAIVDGVSVELARCVLESGMGANGAPGEAQPAEGAASGGDGSPGAAACTASQVFGGDGAVNVCGRITSQGGLGGVGASASGSPGGLGEPQGAPNGGAGEAAAACTPGGAGEVGPNGTPGAGATALGTIDATGFVGVAGGDGAPGVPGQGGGGGGGAKGGAMGAMKCADMAKANGASGGGGAAGGCGGAGGRGGSAGGSSIALVILGASIAFDDVVLRTKAAGHGGNGGAGQPGGAGGMGGAGGSVGAATALKAGCAGGNGGSGGSGGQGGGGRGGHAIGVAWKGTAPSLMGAVVETGASGKGGLGAEGIGSGADGFKEDSREFP